MINKLKSIKLTKRGIYISLAICMILVGTVGIFTSVRNMNKIIEEADVELDQMLNTNEALLNNELLQGLDQNNDVEPTISETKEIVLSFIAPVAGEVIKEHSKGELVYSETMNDYRTHCGVDFSSEVGEPVYSCEQGTITDISDDPLWGTTVTVEHPNGYVSCYKNLADSIPEGVEIGSHVAKGGVIGTVGSSSLVEIGEEPHVHFEMMQNGEQIDPMDKIS